MPRKDSAFRFSRKDVGRLSSAVRNFNRKVESVSEIPGLTISYQQIKAKIVDRNSYNRELKRLQRINKPGALDIVYTDNGAPLLKWEKREADITRRAINTRRRNLRNTMGIPEGYKLGEELRNILQDKPDYLRYQTNRSMVEQYLKNLSKQADYDYFNNLFETYKENLITAYSKNYPSSPTLSNFISYLKSKKAMDLWNAGIDSTINNIEFAYTQLESDTSLNESVQYAFQQWKRYFGDPIEAEDINLLGPEEYESIF